MQFSNRLSIGDAVIGDVKIRSSNGRFSNRVELKGLCTPELAEALGCKTSVYAENGTPHEGFTYLEDSTAGCAAFRALLQADGLKQKIEFNGDKVDGVSFERVGKNGQVRVRMMLRYTGAPHDFFTYWATVGTQPGVCEVTPLQQELEAADTVEAELVVRDPSTGETTRTKIPKETLRKAVGASKRVQ